MRHQFLTLISSPRQVFGTRHVHDIREVGVDAPVEEVDAILRTVRGDSSREAGAEAVQVTTASRDPLFLIGIQVNQTDFLLHDVHAVMTIR